MSHPYLVEGVWELSQFSPIEPRFPNWQKSFVSGPNSPLFETRHFECTVDPKLVLTQASFKDLALGPPGHVHGGATAGIIDEVMGICVWHQGFKCVTQALEIRYLKPLPLDVQASIYTRAVQVNEKTIEVHSTLYDEKKIARISARGIFHQLSDAQLAQFKEQWKPGPV